MQICEVYGRNIPVEPPDWVRFLFRMGFSWPVDSLVSRAICLVSMPCESAAAGVIGLGLMCRGLCTNGATDVELHWDKMLDNARGVKKKVRNVDNPERVFDVKEVVPQYPELIHVVSRRRSDWINKFIGRGNCMDWYFAGDRPEMAGADGGLESSVYEELIRELGAVEIPRIEHKNLRTSFSGLQFVGSHLGKPYSKKCLEGLQIDGLSIAQLITIDWKEPGWSCPVSRMNFYNPRADESRIFDRPPLSGRSRLRQVAVVDGIQSFSEVLRVRNNRACANMDLIGVINRTADRDILEDMGNLLNGLGQWYSSSVEADGPPGIVIRKLTRR